MATPTKSRLNQARAAIRPSMKGRVMLSGPSGAGKTYTGLLIATYLTGDNGRILHIDTEKESSLTYADLFTFEHLRWNAPYDAAALAQTIMEAGREYDAIIVDSFSHFWRKQGGILDVANGKFTGWANARPLQEDVTEAILETDAHVIVCCRSKMEHVQETANGRIEVRKIGMKAQQDDDLEYEVNISLEVTMEHELAVSKSRTNAIPVGMIFQPSHAGEFATKYRDWLAGGEPVAARADTDALAAMLNTISDEAERYKAKMMFLDGFGRPEFLLVSRLEEAREWCAQRVAGVALPADRAEDQVPAEGAGHETAPESAPVAPRAPAGTAAGYQGDRHAYVGDGPLCGACQKGPGHPAHANPFPGGDPDDVENNAEPAAPPAGIVTPHHGDPGQPVETTADPTANAQEQVAALQATLEHTDAERARKQLITEILAYVAELSPMEVVKQLTDRGQTTNGAPKRLRDALVDFYVNVAEGRQVDPTTCQSCGGYQETPPPFLDDRPRCECPID